MGILKRALFVASTPLIIVGIGVYSTVVVGTFYTLALTVGPVYYIVTGKWIPSEYIHLHLYLDKTYNIEDKIGNFVNSL